MIDATMFEKLWALGADLDLSVADDRADLRGRVTVMFARVYLRVINEYVVVLGGTRQRSRHAACREIAKMLIAIATQPRPAAPTSAPTPVIQIDLTAAVKPGVVDTLALDTTITFPGNNR